MTQACMKQGDKKCREKVNERMGKRLGGVSAGDEIESFGLLLVRDRDGTTGQIRRLRSQSSSPKHPQKSQPSRSLGPTRAHRSCDSIQGASGGRSAPKWVGAQ